VEEAECNAVLSIIRLVSTGYALLVVRSNKERLALVPGPMVLPIAAMQNTDQS